MGKSQAHVAFPFFNFEGGINTRFGQVSLATNEFEDGENFLLEARGGLEKRSGYDWWQAGDTATTHPIVGLHQYRSNNGTPVALRFQNAKAEKLAAGVWTDITGTVVVTAGQDNRWVFANYRDNTIGTNGVSVPVKWNGSGNFALVTQTVGANSLEKAATLCLHNDKIVLGDVTISGTRDSSKLLWSDVGTLDTWDAANILEVDQGDGDTITSLQSVLGYLVVFKQHSLHRVSALGIDNEMVRKKVAAVGTAGPHTSVAVGNLVFFLDAEGRFWAYDPRGTDEDAMAELSKNKLGNRTYNSFVFTRLKYAHLLHHPHRNEIWCFLTDGAGTATNVCWVYNITSGGFARMRFAHNFNYSALWLDSNNHPQLVGGTTGGQVVQLDEGKTDLGTTITAYLATGQSALNDVAVEKGFRQVDIYTDTDQEHVITFEHLVDFHSTGDVQILTAPGIISTWGTAVYGTSRWTVSGAAPIETRLRGFGRWLQMKLTHAAAQSFKLLGYLVYVTDAGERRIQ